MKHKNVYEISEMLKQTKIKLLKIDKQFDK